MRICKCCSGKGFNTALCDYSWGYQIKSIPCQCAEGKRMEEIQKIDDGFVRGYILGRLGKTVNLPEKYLYLINKKHTSKKVKGKKVGI